MRATIDGAAANLAGAPGDDALVFGGNALRLFPKLAGNMEQAKPRE
ncbi:MAG TPA: hypothetical protein VGN97_10235 [Mesorhizobium sp.]|nr:hypothetical protein [Mesorhizobium sp.]